MCAVLPTAIGLCTPPFLRGPASAKRRALLLPSPGHRKERSRSPEKRPAFCMKVRDDSEWRSLVPGKTDGGRQARLHHPPLGTGALDLPRLPLPARGCVALAPAPLRPVLSSVPSVLRSLRGPSSSFPSAERSPRSPSSSAAYPRGNRPFHDRLSFPRSARGAGDVQLARGSVRKGWSRPVQSERECGRTRVGLLEGPGPRLPGQVCRSCQSPSLTSQTAGREVLGCVSPVRPPAARAPVERFASPSPAKTLGCT